MTKNLVRFLAIALCAGLAASACSSGMRRKTAGKDGGKAGAKGAQDGDAAYTPGVDVTEASLRGSDFAVVDGLVPVNFDYDSHALTPSALAALKTNALYLKENKGDVLVAGHTDERGTIEYNLALGQRRAKEVREYYIRLGVNGKRLATISYGKESPSCAESTEDCWAQNRRAETRMRAATADAGTSKPRP
jgi:peptidoglycan-associated lipoprotein